MKKRFIIIVLDSFGVGELPDAGEYGDTGSNTLAAVAKSGQFKVPNMEKLGLLNIDGSPFQGVPAPMGVYGRMMEQSAGKDTTTGHWELAGVITEYPMPTYPNGFPEAPLKKLSVSIGRGILCNRPYSGTQVLTDYGAEHVQTGDIILYTSADSVLQIAAHEEVVPLTELYQICKVARGIMTGEHGVGRIIARPFIGDAPQFVRTANRKDFSLEPPQVTMLDVLTRNQVSVTGIGKIYDIFAGKGITNSIKTKNNTDGMEALLKLLDSNFAGLCFVNLVDFDMIYGHRNDVDGYAKALSEFDLQLGQLLPKLQEEDILVITADHGCDPSTPSTDHSREYVPLLIWGDNIKSGVNLGTRHSFADLAATVQEYFSLSIETAGVSFLPML